MRKWVPPEEYKPPPPGPSKGKSEQALAMNAVGLNLEGVTKNMEIFWLADSGALCHVTFSKEGVYDCKDVHVPIKIGNSKSMITTKIGNKKVTMVLADGQMAELVLDNCKLVPNLRVNLFRTTQNLRKGWNLKNEGFIFVLTKSEFKITFDKIIKTSHGHVNGIELIPVINMVNLTLEHGT
jgi:hypothetical protein